MCVCVCVCVLLREVENRRNVFFMYIKYVFYFPLSFRDEE